MSDDPYRPLCVHGTLPLVSDPGSACGFRFAVLGEDPVSACISDPAELPDADIGLRMFGSPREIEGYIAALDDMGGNNLSTLVAPASANTPPFLLLVRHDRSRQAADTLDDAVRLIGEHRPDPAPWAQKRSRALQDLAAQRHRDSLDDRWSDHRKAIQGKRGFWLSDTTDAGVEFMTNHGGTRFVLGGSASSPVVSWNPVVYRFDPDLAEIFAAGVAEAGVVSPSLGNYRIALADLSEPEILRALGAERQIGLLEEKLADLADARRRVAEIHANPLAMTVLRRAVDGLPVLTKGIVDPGLQLAPRTANGQTIPGVLITRLTRARLLTLAWKPDQSSTRLDTTSFCPAIYVATPAAHLLVEGDTKGAAESLGNLRSSSRETDQLYLGSLTEALTAMSADLAPEKRNAIAKIIEKRLTAYGIGLDLIVRGGRSSPEWVPLVMGFLGGLVDIDDDLVVHRTSPDPSPGPRP